MKIVGTSNFGHENFSEFFPSNASAAITTEQKQEWCDARNDDRSYVFFKLVEDDHVLYKWTP